MLESCLAGVRVLDVSQWLPDPPADGMDGIRHCHFHGIEKAPQVKRGKVDVLHQGRGIYREGVNL